MKTEKLRALLAEMTPGPWAWSYIGEKVNGYVIGGACDVDGKPLTGCVDEADLPDQVLYKSSVGEHEAATCNYADPAAIVTFVNHAAALLDVVEAARAWCEASNSGSVGVIPAAFRMSDALARLEEVS